MSPENPESTTAPATPLEPVPVAPAERPLTLVEWSVAEGLALVVFAIVLTLLAGLVTARVFASGLSDEVQSLIVGGLLLLTYAGQAGAAWVSGRTRGVSSLGSIGFWPIAPVVPWVLAAVGVAAGMRVFEMVYEALLRAGGVALSGQNLDMTRILPPGVFGTAFTVVLLVVIAPIAEEVVFRGVLLSAFRARWGDVAGITVSAAIFSAVHLNPYSFLPLFVLGASMGALFVKSRSLWTAVIAHAAFNGLGVMALYALRALGLQ